MQKVCIISGGVPLAIARALSARFEGRKTHILRLPPGSVVTFTKLFEGENQHISIVNKADYAPTVVEHALLGPALRSLLLLLLFDLGGLGLDFTSTGEGAVNYISESKTNGEPELVRDISSGENDLFPCCLEVGVLEDVGGDGKIATVQSLPTSRQKLELRGNVC